MIFSARPGVDNGIYEKIEEYKEMYGITTWSK